MKKQTRNNESGFALLTVVVLSWLVFALSLSFMELIVNEKKMIHITEHIMTADAMSEAGMEEVLYEFNYGGGDFDGASGWVDSGADKVKTVNPFQDNSGNDIGNYTITVTNWGSNAPTVTVHCIVNGTGPGLESTFKATLKPRPVFNASVKAQGIVSLDNNAFIDSYDSSAGSYGGANVLETAYVATKQNIANAIVLASSSEIRGDVGLGGSSGTVSDVTKITGGISHEMLDSVTSNTVPSSLTALSDSGVLNTTQTLTAGSYKYQKVSMSSGESLTIDGNVTLYLTGDATSLKVHNTGSVTLSPGSELTVYADGNIIIQDSGTVNYSAGAQDSTTVKVYCTSTADSVSIEGSGIFVGAINAPDSDLSMTDDAKLYGSVICNDASLINDSVIHFDRHIIDNGPTSGLKLHWSRKV